MVFDKWYTDSGFQHEFIDGTEISNNITLYATYRAPTQSYIVTYVSDGQQIFAQEIME
jgi:uncharacterized repeat protein (TIGR02543 family)